MIAIAVSSNNRHIALYSDTGHLYIGSIDFKEKYCECYTNMKESLANIAWFVKTLNQFKLFKFNKM